MSNKVKRRLTVYPGQISLIFNQSHATELLTALTNSFNAVPLEERGMVRRFLNKLESAIATGDRLSSKQSATDRGNS